MLFDATRKDILDILKFKHKELIDKIGLGLCTLSVPIQGKPFLKVTVLSKPEHSVPQSITIDWSNQTYVIPIEVVIGNKITPC